MAILHRDRPELPTDPAYGVPESYVLAVRVACRDRGVNVDSTVDWPLRKLIDRVGCDLDLAVTAIVMEPRPRWVERLVGEP